MWKEFKEFAMKGKIMDLAVGVVIGGAFQGIVKSLVDDIIMPVITIFTGKMDFSELTFTLGNSSIKYGSFITAVINFLIIAFSIFLFVRCPYCFTEINIHATRCPHCTSVLEQKEEAKEEQTIE